MTVADDKHPLYKPPAKLNRFVVLMPDNDGSELPCPVTTDATKEDLERELRDFYDGLVGLPISYSAHRLDLGGSGIKVGYYDICNGDGYCGLTILTVDEWFGG